MSIKFDGITEDVQKIITGASNKVTINKDGTYAVDKDTYDDSLKEAGINVNDAKKVYKHLSDFIAATAGIVGEKANQVAKGDKEFADVTVKVPLLDRSIVAVNWRRESQSRNPRTGELTTNHGVLTTKVGFSGTNKSGNYGKIRDSVRERAAKLLA